MYQNVSLRRYKDHLRIGVGRQVYPGSFLAFDCNLTIVNHFITSCQKTSCYNSFYSINFIISVNYPFLCSTGAFYHLCPPILRRGRHWWKTIRGRVRCEPLSAPGLNCCVHCADPSKTDSSCWLWRPTSAVGCPSNPTPVGILEKATTWLLGPSDCDSAARGSANRCASQPGTLDSRCWQLRKWVNLVNLNIK